MTQCRHYFPVGKKYSLPAADKGELTCCLTLARKGATFNSSSGGKTSSAIVLTPYVAFSLLFFFFVCTSLPPRLSTYVRPFPGRNYDKRAASTTTRK